MAGLLGVGGGIIIVPISYFVLLYLDYSSDYAMHIAIASSLGVICFTSISSIRTHLKLKNVNFIKIPVIRVAVSILVQVHYQVCL